MSVNCKVVNTPGVTIGDGTGIVTTFVTSNGQTVSLDGYVSKNGDSEIKGNITATSFVKKNGTSSQFLKADGSSDSSRIFVNETNVAIGADSLISNTGVDNMAFGKNALKFNTSGSYNTAIGSVALLENISGNNNAAIGTGALMKNTTGKHNTGIGVVSLYENLTGDYNLAMGVNALQNNTTGNGNTSCGVESMMANATGNNNTALGYKADVDSADLTNATAIGSNAKVTSSNTIQLGDTNVTMVNTSASITASSFVKSGGSASEFLKANGTVDSSEYLQLSGGTLTGNLNLQQLLINNKSAFATNTGSIYYNGSTMISSVPSFFGNLSEIGTRNAVTQETTNNATKISLIQFTNTDTYHETYGNSVGYLAGLSGTNNTYLSGAALYVGVGFNFSCSFGFGGTHEINKNRFMCGFTTNTDITTYTDFSRDPSSAPNWFGIGVDAFLQSDFDIIGDATFSFISNGSSLPGTKTATSYPANIVSNDVYTLNVYNPVNSNTIFLTLSSVLTTGQSSTSFTLSTASTGVSINQRIYPVLYRYEGPNPNYNTILLNFGKMTFTSFS